MTTVFHAWPYYINESVFNLCARSQRRHSISHNSLAVNGSLNERTEFLGRTEYTQTNEVCNSWHSILSKMLDIAGF